MVTFWNENNITKGQENKASLTYEDGNVILEAVSGTRFTYNSFTNYSSVIVRAYGLY